MGQSAHLNGCARGQANAEIVMPDIDVLEELIDVGDEGRGLDQIAQRRAGGFQRVLDVLTDLLALRADIGMSFQENALFDSLTVNENVGYRLYEETDMPLEDVRRRVDEVLEFVGLSQLADRMPTEISGGQRRRVGIARAMASNPELLLFDDPTTGLDPLTAASVDEELACFGPCAGRAFGQQHRDNDKRLARPGVI